MVFKVSEALEPCFIRKCRHDELEATYTSQDGCPLATYFGAAEEHGLTLIIDSIDAVKDNDVTLSIAFLGHRTGKRV